MTNWAMQNSIKMSNRYVISILILILFSYSCRQENDFIINDERVGNLKLEMTTDQVLNELSNYKITRPHNLNSDKNTYLIVKDNEKVIMHLNFYSGALNGIKVYDKKYTTSSGIRIGNTAQEAINKGISISFIHFGEDEGLRCELLAKDVFKKWKRLSNLQFYFSRSVYHSGHSRNIGKNALLESFVLGNDFNINWEIKSDEEQKIIAKELWGELKQDIYTNKYFGIDFRIPNTWYATNYKTGTDDFYELFTIINDSTNCSLALSAQKRTIYKSAKEYLADIGLTGKLEPYLTANIKFYKFTEQRDNKKDKKVFFATIIKGNAIMFIGKYYSYDDYLEIEKIINSLTLR